MTEKCGAIGALMVGGRVVGQIKCELDAGHDDPELLAFDIYGMGAENHRVVLEWTSEREVDLDLFDPDEHFDADVPMPAVETSDPHCPHTSVGVCFRCAVHGGSAVEPPTHLFG